jgi:1-phosphatidylinositol-3-phosphate 5-kinase
MEEYRDDDDAKSINSVATSARLPNSADRAIESMSPDLPYSKSPFAASQLFSINPDDTLDAIEEGVPTRWNAESDESPSASDDDAVYDKRPPATAVPFRRAIEEEHRSATGPSASPSVEASPRPQDEPIAASSAESSMPPPPVPSKAVKKRRVEFPRSDTMSTEGNPERAPLVRVDSIQPLIGLRTRLSSRNSQSGLTSLIDAEKSEGLWRARSNSFA